MEFALLIYAIEVLSGFGTFSAIMLLVGGMVLGVALVIAGVDGDTPKIWALLRSAPVYAKGWVCLLVVSAFLVPTQVTMHAMIAAYAGQAVLESSTVERLAPKSLQLLESYLDKQLEEMEVE